MSHLYKDNALPFGYSLKKGWQFPPPGIVLGPIRLSDWWIKSDTAGDGVHGIIIPEVGNV